MPLLITAESTLTKRQRAKFGPKHFNYGEEACTITAEVRYDDDCGNGHNTFSITGTIRAVTRQNPRDDRERSGGCIHEEIAQAFPELAPLIKWHLCSSDGPLHYPGNALFHASEKDCWGRVKGEPSNFEHGIRFEGVPITHRIRSKVFFNFLKERWAGQFSTFIVVAFAHDRDPKTYSPNYSFAGFGEKWHECPFHDKTEADEFCEAMNTCKPEFVTVPTAWSEGKERDLNAARHCAIWPEATDEELTAPGLKQALDDRLPALLVEFRAAVESLGFVW